MNVHVRDNDNQEDNNEDEAPVYIVVNNNDANNGLPIYVTNVEKNDDEMTVEYLKVIM